MPSAAAFDYRQKALLEDQFGFDLSANSDSPNLEYIGPNGRVMRGRLPLRSLYLEMDPHQAELLFYKQPHDNSSFAVTVLQGVERIPGRITVKGSSTRYFIKKSFLIKIDKETSATWGGYKLISINALVTDPSMMREWLSWDLARASGLTTLNTIYTRLYINQKYVGLYSFTEWVTGDLFARAGLGAKGELYQPNDATYCGDLSGGSEDPSRHCYLKFFPPDNNFTTLDGLIKGVSSTPTKDFHGFMDNNFDDDSVINWVAVNALVANGDTYNKNYFLYFSRETSRWTVMPWDYDLTFGRSWDPYLPSPNDVFNDNFVYYYSPEIGFPGMLKVKMLENPILFQRFKRRLGHLLGVGEPDGDPRTYGWFSPERFAARVNAIKYNIGSDALLDPFSATRLYSFDEQADALKYFVLGHYANYKMRLFSDTANWTSYTYDPTIPMMPPPAQSATLNATWDARSPGYERPLVDPYLGTILAVLKVRTISQPATIVGKVVTFRPPAELPLGRVPSQCVQRSWTLTAKMPETASLTSDITLEYMQENSQNSEVGSKVKRQKDLLVWMQQGDEWEPQLTVVNGLAKTLTVRNISFPPNRPLRFVACADVPFDMPEQDVRPVEKENPVSNPVEKVYRSLMKTISK